jgi:hypothetical protein
MNASIKKLQLVAMIALVIACKSPKDNLRWSTHAKNVAETLPARDSVLILAGIAESAVYGYSPKMPIKLGVKSLNVSQGHPEQYLKSITGPRGESVVYRRLKSCCFFRTINSDPAYQNVGVLEMYEVSVNGDKKSRVLYLNFFDEGKIYAPQGFLPKVTSK